MAEPTEISIRVELRTPSAQTAQEAGPQLVVGIGAGQAAAQLANALWPHGPGPHVGVELVVIGKLERGALTLRHAASIGGQGTQRWKPEQAGAAAERAAIRVVDFLHKHANAEEPRRG